MIREGPFNTESAGGIDSRTTVDFFVALLSDKDLDIRRRSVVALGASGDRKAVEPLMFALSRELSLGAESFAIVMDIVEALERLPDSRAIDLLLKVESLLIDYGSTMCRADMPVGSVVYHSKGDRHIDRVVPRELHYKVFEGLRRISTALGDRTELVADRFHAYQLEAMEEEVNRLMPMISDALADSAPDILPAGDVVPVSATDDEEAVSGNYFDHELVKQEMEAQVLDYISRNEDMLTIIQNGQRIKAHIRQARETKVKMATDIPVRLARAFVR